MTAHLAVLVFVANAVMVVAALAIVSPSNFHPVTIVNGSLKP